MGKGFARSVQGKKLYKNLVNLLMMGLKPLIKYLDYYQELEKNFASIFMTTRDDLGKDRHNTYHTSISLSFINKCVFDKQETRTRKQPGLGMK